MRVAIAGAHGKIAAAVDGPAGAGGDTVLGLIRNPDHSAEIEQLGGVPVICDLEQAGRQEVAELIVGADAVVFAAGAGPGSGAERKLTMDRDGAIKLLGAASDAGVPRYVIVSSVGAEAPPPDDDEHNDVFDVYLRAKAEADAAVRGSAAAVDDRPPRPAHRRSRHGARPDRHPPHRGEVPRDDVAAVLARCFTTRRPRARSSTSIAVTRTWQTPSLERWHEGAQGQRQRLRSGTSGEVPRAGRVGRGLPELVSRGGQARRRARARRGGHRHQGAGASARLPRSAVERTSISRWTSKSTVPIPSA